MKLTAKLLLVMLLASLILLTGCQGPAPKVKLPVPSEPPAPLLHSQPTPPAPPPEAKGVWFPLADAGELRKYIEELRGWGYECQTVIEGANH